MPIQAPRPICDGQAPAGYTHANHALDAGSDVRDVQTDLGHAGLSTTTHYTEGNDARRYQAVNGFFEDTLSAGGT